MKPQSGELIGRPRQSRRGIRCGGSSGEPSKKKERPTLPRTFNRNPVPWLQVIFDLPPITGESILALRRDVLNLSREDVSRILRVRRNTIWDWETGVRRPPFSAYLALRCLADSAKRSVLPVDPAPEVSAPDPAKLVPILEPGERSGYRGRVRQLQARMNAFKSIYNSAWLVRDAWYGPPMRRQESVWKLTTTLLSELKTTHDFEALLYALADSLTCSKQGAPWKDDSEQLAAGWRKIGKELSGNPGGCSLPAPDPSPTTEHDRLTAEPMSRGERLKRV